MSLTLTIRYIAVGFLVGACTAPSIESTIRYYQPLTSKVYPCKPPTSPVTIYYRPPAYGAHVIGQISISGGFDFVKAALEYNARRVGADSVYIVDSDQLHGLVNVTPHSASSISTPPTPPPHANAQQTKDYQKDLKNYYQDQAFSSPNLPSKPVMEERSNGFHADAVMVISGE